MCRNVGVKKVMTDLNTALTSFKTINIYMVLLISALATIGAMQAFFFCYGSPTGEGGACACVGMVCYQFIY